MVEAKLPSFDYRSSLWMNLHI